MKNIITYLFLCLFLSVNAQETFNKLLEVGISNHDSGNYKEAIKYYKKALEIQPDSDLINYEISLSYATMKDYKRAIEYCDKVLTSKDKKYLLPAYVNKGSSLDMLGETKKSIKVFEKAINKLGDHYSLHFNLAINYLKVNDLDSGEDHLKKAVDNNNLHASSHFYLSKINNDKGNRVESLLASYFFLLVEPASIRSEEIYDILKFNLQKGVKKEDDKNISINLNLNDSSEFSIIETMLSILEASKNLEDNKGKTEEQLFVENTTSFFKIMGEFNEDEKKESIWRSFYIPFFYKLSKSDHIATFCKLITIIDIKSKSWVEANEDKVDSFFTWIEEQ